MLLIQGLRLLIPVHLLVPPTSTAGTILRLTGTTSTHVGKGGTATVNNGGSDPYTKQVQAQMHLLPEQLLLQVLLVLHQPQQWNGFNDKYY